MTNDKSLLAVIDVLCDTVLEDPRAAHHLKNPQVQLFSNEKCVSREAIRFHLKNIFSKTGVKRQGELIRLVLTLPAAPEPGLQR